MIQRVGIVGAGTMGAGIMINCVTNGMPVVLHDLNEEVLKSASEKLSKYLDRQVSKERISKEQARSIETHLTVSTDVQALRGCDLVIEAVFEDLALKKRIFAGLEAALDDDVLLATNTSCLRLADISQSMAKVDRFCGMHYFSPAEINPVVELIKCEGTSEITIAAVSNFLTVTQKQAIPCRDNNGFALNRFFCPYTNEAARVLDDGIATIGQIDQIAKDRLGLALGPFAVMNIVGLPTSMKAQQSLAGLGPFYQVANSLEERGSAGAPWAVDEIMAAPADDVAAAVADRLIGAILLPVLELLSEGTARLEDVNKGAELAFRFGRTPGQLARDLGADEVRRVLNLVGAPMSHPIPEYDATLFSQPRGLKKRKNT